MGGDKLTRKPVVTPVGRFCICTIGLYLSDFAAGMTQSLQLFHAVATGDGAAVRRACSLNPALVHAKHPRHGQTLLHAAAAVGSLSMLRDLLHAGASCQAQDRLGETPLHVAARQGQAAIVRELLTDAGRRSCLRATNEQGSTPLHLAVLARHVETARALINAGARCDARDKAGRSAMDVADAEVAEVIQRGRQLTPVKAHGGVGRRLPTSATGSPVPTPVLVAPDALGSMEEQPAEAPRLSQDYQTQQTALDGPLGMGPLRRAQVAGPGSAGAAAAAAAADDLARSFFLRSASAGFHAGAGQARGLCGQPGAGCGGITSPEASVGLLQTEQAWTGLEAAQRSAMSGSIGPLQQPLQVQMTEVAARVHQLEVWAMQQAGRAPEWQAAAELVQALKRQLEEQVELLASLAHTDTEQGASLQALMERMAELGEGHANAAGEVEQHGVQLVRAAELQDETRGTLAELSCQIGDLQAQLVRVASAEEEARMAAAMAAQAAFGERMAALTARVAVLESASPQCDASDSAAQLALPHRASVETPELAELQERVADLSMMVASSASVAGAASEAVLLSFMDATSSCLSAHEQQLDALQALLPRIEGFVVQRGQVCELRSQVAALQTALTLLTGRTGDAGNAATAAAGHGALGAHKATPGHLELASSMVTLQGQLSALSTAHEQLQLDWRVTAASLAAEKDAISAAWEAERSRMAAAEREAARRLADQQRELRAREDRLAGIREAAILEEAARRSALADQERLHTGLAELLGRHERLEGRIDRVADATEALREQLAALQTEVLGLLQCPPARSARGMPADETAAAAPAPLAAAMAEDPSNPFLEPPKVAGSAAACEHMQPAAEHAAATHVAVQEAASEAPHARKGWLARRCRRGRKGGDQAGASGGRQLAGEAADVPLGTDADMPPPRSDAPPPPIWAVAMRKLAGRSSRGGAQPHSEAGAGKA